MLIKRPTKKDSYYSKQLKPYCSISELASAFGYSSEASLRNSTAYRQMLIGCVWLAERIKQKLREQDEEHLRNKYE